MLCNSLDVDAVLPWETDGKLTASQIEDFWKAFGITLPYDYSFNDDGVTPNSDYDDQHFTGEVELITFGYESLDIKYNGDGTFTLNGKFQWAADGDDYYEKSTKGFDYNVVTVDFMGVLKSGGIGLYFKYSPMSVLKKNSVTAADGTIIENPQFKALSFGLFF